MMVSCSEAARLPPPLVFGPDGHDIINRLSAWRNMDTLFNQLVVSCAKTLPFSAHARGHKRNTALAPYLKKLAADIDITEILGFDHLHALAAS